MKAKSRTCRICKVKKPYTEMFYTNCKKAFCSPECGATLSLEILAKQKAKRDSEFKSETRKRKESIKKLSEWIKEAQVEFNKYIRLRDEKLPCVSCGRSAEEVEKGRSFVGGYWDAGHYKTRGAYPELRFEPLNCHKQCKVCNGGSNHFSKKSESVKKGYDNELVKRIGVENFEWLNGPHRPKNYTIEEVKEIKAKYRKMHKELLDDSCN